jgi:hypothetical protein
MLLEQKGAYFGQSTPPEIIMEIDDLKQKLEEIDKKTMRTIKIARHMSKSDTQSRKLPSDGHDLMKAQESDNIIKKWWHNEPGLSPVYNLDYTETPFLHGWYQYEKSGYANCLSIHMDGVLNDLILYKSGGFSNAVSYPEIGTWLRMRDPIYVLPIKPDGNFHVYFNVFTRKSSSNYLIYTNSGNNSTNIYGEQEVVISSELLFNGSWHFLVFNIAADVKKFFDSDFVHLNWICLRGNFQVSEMISVAKSDVFFEN